MPEKFADVVLPIPLRSLLTYRVPSHLQEQIRAGTLVKVPLGTKRLTGCVLEISEKAPDFETKEILAAEISDGSRQTLPPPLLKLLKWASAYYLTPPGEVLRHLFPSKILKTQNNPQKNLKKARKAKAFPDFRPFEKPPTPKLHPEQEAALSAILEEMEAPKPAPVLIHGVTGSGKTEVYIETARRILDKGGQVLILVPEIGLTPQLVGRFFGLSEPPTAYHSGLTEAQRLDVWKGAREGRIRLVIATRSGIFLPFEKLRLTVIDEEHDSSYKQEERFCYHARDLALWRAGEEKALILLGSATPSLETLQRVKKGKIREARLSVRPIGSPPRVRTIDLRMEKKGHFILSRDLQDAIAENLRARNQTLLFLNRRGFSPFVLCPGCGFVPRCSSCDISLTLHRPKSGSPDLVCHYCDRHRACPRLCTECGKEAFLPMGFGTERIESEIRRLFPSARLARLDRDATAGGEWLRILERMKRREIDILIGTQMITKGHDYPGLTLVGVIDADVSMNLPDFRAGERTFQILTQVSGRAGRGGSPGQVLIQTFLPDHPLLVSATRQDGESFYAREVREREQALYPPFVRLIEIRLSGIQKDKVIDAIRTLARRIDSLKNSSWKGTLNLLGPAPCPIEKVRGKTRWRILLKTTEYAKLQPRLRSVLDGFAANDLPSNIRLLVNVDPVDMM